MGPAFLVSPNGENATVLIMLTVSVWNGYSRLSSHGGFRVLYRKTLTFSQKKLGDLHDKQCSGCPILGPLNLIRILENRPDVNRSGTFLLP